MNTQPNEEIAALRAAAQATTQRHRVAQDSLAAETERLLAAGIARTDISDAKYAFRLESERAPWELDLLRVYKECDAARVSMITAELAYERAVLSSEGSPCAAARAAAKWWADCTRGHGPGDDAGDAMVNMILAWAGTNKPTRDAGASDRFEADLAIAIDADIRAAIQADRTFVFGYSVDYHPDPRLGEIAERHGVRGLPIKTSMWLRPSHVEVSAGYRAPVAVVYEAGISQ